MRQYFLLLLLFGIALCRSATALCPPEAGTAFLQTSQGQRLEASLLPYVFDVDGNLDVASLTVSWSANSPSSTVLGGPSGVFAYVPEADFVGVDTLTYSVCDLSGSCATGELLVLVTPASAVVANDDVFGPFVRAGASLAPLSLDVLGNDGPTAAALADCDVVVVSQPAAGVAYFDGQRRTVTFLAEAGQLGSVRFEYKLFDRRTGASDLASVEVTVAALTQRLPEPPQLADRRFAVAVNASAQLLLPSLLATASDPDGDLDAGTLALLTSGTGGGGGGAAWLLPGGELVYQPAAGYVGFDMLPYQLCDATGLCARANVYVTVVEQRAPSVQAAAARTSVGTPVTFNPLLTAVSASPLDYGSLTVSGVAAGASVAVNTVNGQLTFVAAAEGVYTFTFRVCSQLGEPLCAAAEAVVVVNRRSPPLPADDAGYAASGQRLTVDVLQNDYDPDDDLDAASLTISSEPVSGARAYVRGGAVVYQSDAGYAGVDTLFYTVCDSAQQCASARLSVEVSAPQAPVCRDLFAHTSTDTPVLLRVDVSDADGNVDLGTLAAGAPLLDGASVAVDGLAGALLYTPPPGRQSFTDHFSYFVCDSTSLCAQALATVSSSPNRPPVAADDYAVTAPGVPIVVSWAANDFDVDGNLDASTLAVVTQPPPGQGLFYPLPDGRLLYLPDVDVDATLVAVGQYRVADAQGLLSNVATLRVSVAAAVEAPLTAVDDAATTLESQPVAITVTANDVGGPVNALLVVTPPADGGSAVPLRSADDGQWYVLYTPAAGFVGGAAFTYSVCNGAGCSAAASVGVTVVRLRPLAQDDLASGWQELPLTVDVLANDSDGQGNLDAGSLVVVGAPLYGSATVTADARLLYTPAAGFYGIDDLWYEVCDTSLFCDVARVTLIVRAKLPPRLADDLHYLFEGLVDVPLDVLANDDAASVDAASLQVASQPAAGTLRVDAGRLLFTPPLGFTGTLAASYRVASAVYAELSSEARLVIVVEPNLHAPVAVDDVLRVAIGGAGAVDVLANDADGDDNIDAASVSVVAAPLHGVVTVQADHSLLYTPTAQFAGSDVFAYRVCDAARPALCDTAAVYVDVVANYAPPVTAADALRVWTGQTVDFYPAANDADADGNLDAASVSVTVQPADGSSIACTAGRCTYTAGATPTTYPLAAVYRVCDTSGLCALGDISVRVEADTPPVARDDFVYTAQNTLVEAFVLLNDADAQQQLDAASLALTVAPATGTASAADGRIYYAPQPGFLGVAAMTYRVCDAAGQCASAQLSVTVGVNHPPVAGDDHFVTVQDTRVATPLGANDYDVDGNLDLTSGLAGVGSTAGGRFVLEPTRPGSALDVVFVPAAGFVGTATAPYSLCDAAGLCATATVTVEVRANRRPTADDDRFAAVAGTTLRCEPLANDADEDGNLDFASFALLNALQPGTVVGYNPVTGELSYATAAATRTELLVYRVCDTGGLCANATITVVTAGNRAPTARDDVAQVAAGGAVAVYVTGNDDDVDDNLLRDSLAVSTAPTRGTAVVQPDRSVLYTPAAGVSNAFDTFVYRVCDALALCDTAVVTVAIVDAYPRPIAVADAASTPVGTPVDVDALSNDVNVGQTTRVSMAAAPTVGYAYYAPAERRWRVTPDPGFVGVLTFAYQLCSPSGACSTANVSVFVTANTPPVAVDDRVTTAPGQLVVVNVLANDVDADGNLDAASLAVVSPPAGNTMVAVSDGRVSLLAPAAAGATLSFLYRVCDLSGDCATASVLVDVLANRPPVAVDDYAATLPLTPVVVDVLANDFDADNNIDAASLTVVQPPASGLLRLVAPTGRVVYTPVYGSEDVSDSFSYRVADSAGATATATVHVRVGVNHPPTAVADYYQLTSVQPRRIDIAANDYDVDGNIETRSVRVVAPPSRGVVAVDAATGACTYTPASALRGIDQFTYVVADALGAASPPATVTLAMLPPGPLAVDDFATTPLGVGLVIDVTANDYLPADDGAALPPSIVSPPLRGVAVVLPSGAVAYTPQASGDGGVGGRDSFVYRLCDRSQQCDVAVVVVYVAPAHAPQLADDVADAVAGAVLSVDVLANDFDADGDIVAASLTIVSATTGGRAAVDSDGGLVVFLPDAGFVGSATVTYQLCDASALCGQATLTVRVGANRPPVAADDGYVLTAGTGSGQLLDVLANDYDGDDGLDAASLTVTADLDAAVGVLAVNRWTGSLSLLLNAAAAPGTSATFSYRVCDAAGQCDTADVRLAVVARRAPVAVDDAAATVSGRPVAVDVLANDYDVDGDLLPATVTLLTRPAHGALTVDALTGLVSYTPAADYAGADAFSYAAADPFGPSNPATVRLSVAAPRPPTAVGDAATSTRDAAVTVALLDNDRAGDAPLDVGSLSLDSGGGVSAQGGRVAIVAGGAVRYTPPAGYTGADTFSYRVCDALAVCSAPATVVVSVLDPALASSAPVARDDNAGQVASGGDSVLRVAVLANDADADGDLDAGSVRVVVAPAFGRIVFVDALTGDVGYAPLPGFAGVVDAFTYQVCDSAGRCATASVSVAVLANSAAPVARPDAAVVVLGRQVVVDVLANDYDPDGGALVPGSVRAPDGSVVVGGVVSFDAATGRAVFTSDGVLIGAASFDYTVCDAAGSCARGHVAVVVVEPSPFGPNPDLFYVVQDSVLTASVYANDQLADAVSAALARPAAHGSVDSFAPPPGGSFVYTPAPGYTGVDAFAYDLCLLPPGAAQPLCRQAVATVVVLPAAAAAYPPVARPDAVAVLKDTVVATAVAVFANDNDIDGYIDAAATTIVTPPAHGVASTAGLPDSLSYTPAAGYSGVDSFVYRIRDNDGNTADAVVTVTVLPAPPALVLYDYYVKTFAAAPVAVYLLQNNLDPLLTAADVQLAIVSPPPPTTKGVFGPIVAGSLTFTPAPGFVGTVDVPYRGCRLTACTTATLHIDVRTSPNCSQ